jgi:hypothetical protein
MKKKIGSIFYLLFITCEIFSQISPYIELSGNYSMITDASKIEGNILTEESYENKFGFGSNIGLSKKISDRANLCLGVGILKCNYQREIDFSSVSTESQNSSVVIPEPPIIQLPNNYDKIGTTTIYYMNIHLLYKYRVYNKIYLGIGISPSLLVYSKQIRGRNSLYDTNEVIENTSNIGLNKLSINGLISAEYQLIERLNIVFQYNHGFSHIYDENEKLLGNDKLNFFKLGLNYYLKMPVANKRS